MFLKPLLLFLLRVCRLEACKFCSKLCKVVSFIRDAFLLLSDTMSVLTPQGALQFGKRDVVFVSGINLCIDRSVTLREKNH